MISPSTGFLKKSADQAKFLREPLKVSRMLILMSAENPTGVKLEQRRR
jgi:hypothetical protein